MSRNVVAALLVSLAAPAALQADVPVAVPPAFLGGWVLPTNEAAPDGGPAGSAEIEDGVELDDPAFWDSVWPRGAKAIAPPAESEFDCDADPASCGVWGQEAAELEVDDAQLAQIIDASSAGPGAYARALRPAYGTWMTSQTPVLRWTPQPGATRYNVQIFRGSRRVASAWTTAPRLRIPTRVIHQGRYYMWAVWSGSGPAGRPTFASEPLGRSVFGVVLRPRIVFSRVSVGTVGEVRPHIPGGLLVLAAPRALARRTPTSVRVGADGRFRLRLARFEAERLTARLTDLGTDPPPGLRRPRPLH